MILTADDIVYMDIVQPCQKRWVHAPTGMSGGLSQAAYDVSLKQDIILPPKEFSLASTIEHFTMPRNVVGIVHDKSTLVRQGLTVFNTVLDAGWEGYLTLELFNTGRSELRLIAGQPIAQIVFHQLTRPVTGYRGKYQGQPDEPVPARKEV